MKIHGLQKMTLLDYPGHVACTVFLAGCNLRCPFCHNYQLAVGDAPVLMEEEELLRFLSGRRGLLDGVAVSGGEPCLQRELPELLRRVRDMGYRIKLDTNGFFPEVLNGILREGLADYVAMDIKNSPAKYALTCGRDSLDLGPVLESIALLTGGKTDYEFRTTVVRELHEPEDFHAMGALIRSAQRYFLQAFSDRDSVPFAGFSCPDREQMERFAAIAREYVPDTRIRGMEL